VVVAHHKIIYFRSLDKIKTKRRAGNEEIV